VDDDARVVATVLRDPGAHTRRAHELAAPQSVDMTELAAAFSGRWIAPCPMWTHC
jgi:uncharacterized protein YbjT (DUF2867 family)